MKIIARSVARVAKKVAPGQEDEYVKTVLGNLRPTTDP